MKRLVMVCMASLACLLASGARAADDSSAVAARVAALELRKTRLEDHYAITRLQRSYGYYLDQGRWDDAADLFADTGSIELGQDGVFKGKARVRQYLRALGGGRQGLAPGQLNEHLQLMPVVTLSADGQTARGTWRDVMLVGELGKNAWWGEGPFENEYVKHNGVWKIQRVHWFQTLFVPYDGGWPKHSDVNGGRFAPAGLAPDAPPSVAYRSWPYAFTPPFHFRGTGAVPTPQPAPQAIAALQALPAARLAQRAAQLAADVQRLDDQRAIENLQRIYGFYIDKSQWSQAAALFSDDASLSIEGLGRWQGKQRVHDYLASLGPEGVLENRLHDVMQLQPVVHIAPDGRTAKGRWRHFSQLAKSGEFAEWGTGTYENEYVKDNGVWKIRRLHLYPTMFTPYEQGWAKQWQSRSRYAPANAPDAPLPAAREQAGPGVAAPLHYAHPVRGPQPTPARPGARVSADALPAQLLAVERQLSRVEDSVQIENLQMRYGYYLATLLWDDLAALFDDNGTIEIALRGVYVGRAAVRRNLNLYGQAGLDDGVLHNHMQYQPVITVADDGRTAKLRSRALSMMGNAGKSGMWMGGTYENEFVKVDGVWKFRKDQQVNTYFAPYETGWKDLKLRPPPGITDSNPPDRPPSFVFELYPKGFLLPYHYPNPVTGR